jgi:uncharacterized protein YceK
MGHCIIKVRPRGVTDVTLSPLTPQGMLTEPDKQPGQHRETAVRKPILTILLPLAAICLMSGCESNSAEQAKPGPAVAAQPVAAQAVADTAPTEDIPAVDPIWDAMAKQQAHLDQVEKIRTGNSDAVSCQKVRVGPQRRVKVDTSACNPIQLRAEQEAAHNQLFDHMVKTLRHQN